METTITSLSTKPLALQDGNKATTTSYSVDYLLYNKFSTHSLNAKIQIVKHGKPRPPMPSFTFLDDTPPVGIQPTPLLFGVSQYNKTEWLTACPSRRKLFCWPCLLFGAVTMWNTCGVSSPFTLKRMKGHEVSFFHIKSMAVMQGFVAQHFQAPKQDLVLYNGLVQRNRTLLRHVIDAVSFLVMQKRPLNRPHRTGRDVHPMTVDEAVEAVNFMSIHGLSEEDPNIVGDAVFLLRENPKFLNCVVNAVGNVLKFAIKKEAHGSAFVSLILSGHSRDASFHILRSAVLRYLKNGKVCERFIGFYREDATVVKNFHENISRIVTDFQLAQRVLSFAVDGLCPFAIVNSLKNELESVYPYSMLVPCYFHKYWDVLVQILSCGHQGSNFGNGEICMFFEVSESLFAFLKEHREDAESFLSVSLHEILPFESVNNPVVLNWMKANRKGLVEYFAHSLTVPNKWKTDDHLRADAFRGFLSQFSTVYWMVFFIKLFQLTQGINKLLDSPTPETLLVTGVLERILSNLTLEKENGYHQFWNSVIDYLGTELNEEVQNADQKKCYDMYRQSLALVTGQTANRLRHLHSLAFFKLLNPSNFYPVFTDHTPLLNSVGVAYGSGFNREKLSEEIFELYTYKRTLLGFSIEQLLQYMTQYESRKKRLPYMIKLAELVLTMPCIKPFDQQQPVIHKVRAMLPSVNFLSADFSVLSVENELLEETRLRKTFYDEVIDIFSQLAQGMDMFQFKPPSCVGT